MLGDRNLPLKHGVEAGTGLAPEPYAQALGLEEASLEFFQVSEEADAGHGHETVEIIARYTPVGREDDIVAVLIEAMARLRLMMNAVWDLARQIDAELNAKARTDGED
jgi:pyrroloquinoline quinone (PQQ) biosynthesis protein C